MSNYMYSIFLSLLLIGCSQKLEPITKNDTIVAFGDSLTYGYGATSEESYPSQLKQMTGYNVINAGLNGDTAANGVTRIVSVVEQHNPKVVILSLGGNDMLRRNSQNLKSDLKKIISFLKSKKIQVVLLAEPEPSIFALSAGLSDASIYEEVASEENIVVLENIYSKYLSKPEYKSDLIHLNAQGYKRVAEEVAMLLKQKNLLIL
jgi:acyl-CoA thioesterase-1